MNNYFIEQVLDLYDDPKRYYHSRRHITSMLQALDHLTDKLYDLDFDVYEALYMAILFHDVVCIPGNPMHNEASSAIIARNWLLGAGTGQDTVDKVADMILSTAPGFRRCMYPDYAIEHEGQSNDWTLAFDLLHDLDWIGFSDYGMMMENESRILCEMSAHGIGHRMAYGKQLAFYGWLKKEIAETDGLYRTKYYSDRNEQVVENLDRRLREAGDWKPQVSTPDANAGCREAAN